MSLAGDIVAKWKSAQATMTLDANPSTGARYQVANGTWATTTIARVFYQAIETLKTQALLDGILQATGLTASGGIAEWLSAKISGASYNKFRINVVDGALWLTQNASWNGSSWIPDASFWPVTAWRIDLGGFGNAGLWQFYAQASASNPVSWDAATNGVQPAHAFVARQGGANNTVSRSSTTFAASGMPTFAVNVPVSKYYALTITVGYYVQAGTRVRFRVNVDSGASTYQDGAMEASKNTTFDSGPFTFTALVYLSAGSHTLSLDWCTSTGATVNCDGGSPMGWLIVG